MKYALRFLSVIYIFCFSLEANASGMKEWVRIHLKTSPYSVLQENKRDAVDLAYEYKEKYVESRNYKSTRGKELGFYCRQHCTRNTCTGDKNMAKLCREICIEHSNNKDSLNQKCLNKSVLMSGLKRFSKGFSKGLELTANVADTAGEYRRVADPYYTGTKTYEIFNPQTGEMEIVEYDDSLTRFGKSVKKLSKTKKEIAEITKLKKKYPNMTYEKAKKAEMRELRLKKRQDTRANKVAERRERIKKQRMLRKKKAQKGVIDIDLEDADDAIDIEDGRRTHDHMDLDHTESASHSQPQHKIVQVDFAKSLGTVF